MYKNLKNAISENGYSQAFVQEYLGISAKSVLNKFAGAYDFTFTEYRKLCQLLNKYSPEWLFTQDIESKSA